jgi:hypothetical protein
MTPANTRKAWSRGSPLIALALIPVLARGSETFPAKVYDVTTETGMPHLEENLRYTITHQRHCLAHVPFATAFPILAHPALKGCRLSDASRHDETVSYALVCTGGHGTTGEAIWHIDERGIRGTLRVKLGGKNMTFTQHITALPRGTCST